MLADPWVFVQLLTQGLLCLPLGLALKQAWAVLRGWQPTTYTPEQLLLEQRGYFVSASLEIVLALEILLLFVFLLTINHHLVGTVKGAMCATGILNSNFFGYFILSIKAIFIFFFVFFIMLSFFDKQSPELPLTPFKYWLIFPIALLALLDWIVSISFFQAIRPDIITTCCSVNTLPVSEADTSAGANLWTGQTQVFWIIGWGVCFVILLFTDVWALYKPYRWSSKALLAGKLVLNFIYIGIGLYLLKTYFVHYIYGLVTHDCLFDLFWYKYGLIGYVLLLCYVVQFLALLFMLLLHNVRQKVASLSTKTWQIAFFLQLTSLAGSFAIPWVYWIAWGGQLGG
ncbi:MAG TPA: hypothetical protein DCM08_05400 [Microscillaceae bacterium]|jgi:hypothetical protein|nr:hypothetical protein [Microscillaceae bacterium]